MIFNFLLNFDRLAKMTGDSVIDAVGANFDKAVEDNIAPTYTQNYKGGNRFL